MDIYIYSDESGVFDVAHNRYFVYGGIMFLSKDAMDHCARKYLHAEKAVKNALCLPETSEAKACVLSNSYKGKLYRSLNHQIRFGVIINQSKVLPRIFDSKQDKQRYLDYAYKIAVKRCFERLIQAKQIQPDAVRYLHFFVDEHTTATNGRYTLQESLEREFKYGTYNQNYDHYFPPIFSGITKVTLAFCNSEKVTMIRAADIIANRIYHAALNNDDLQSKNNSPFLTFLP